jgi:FAD/FMN-containing dehydrogenase
MSRLLIMTIWIYLTACSHSPQTPTSRLADKSVELNDIHSQLNASKHTAVITPQSVEEIQAAVRDAKSKGQFLSISGGRHSMGGQ